MKLKVVIPPLATETQIHASLTETEEITNLAVTLLSIPLGKSLQTFLIVNSWVKL